MYAKDLAKEGISQSSFNIIEIDKSVVEFSE